MATDLSALIGVLRMHSPLIAASGCFGYGTEYLGLAPMDQFGAIVTKTITPQPRPGNAIPRIWETAAGGMLNSIGLANVGIDRYLVEKLPELREFPTKIIVSVAGNSIVEYADLVAKLEPYSEWHALEINISCPNVKEGGRQFRSRFRHDGTSCCRLSTRNQASDDREADSNGNFDCIHR